MPRKLIPLIDRLMCRVVLDDNGCWLWTDATREGYGVLGRGARVEGINYAHRETYAYFIGPIPDGLHIDHLCRVRACCNPYHLEPVSQAENNLRAARANRRTACRRGHTYTPESSYSNAKQRVCRTCAVVRREAQRSAA